MGDKLEVTLRITLDRPGLERLWGRKVEEDTAFFILGLVHAQMTERFTEAFCQVDMESATGMDQGFVRSMNSFARRYKRALDELQRWGHAQVEDADLVDVIRMLHQVEVTPTGSSWRVVRLGAGNEQPAEEPAPVN